MVGISIVGGDVSLIHPFKYCIVVNNNILKFILHLLISSIIYIRNGYCHNAFYSAHKFFWRTSKI